MAYPQQDSFDLQILEIVKGSQTFDISALYLSINITEDIETPYIQGSLILRDTETFVEQIAPDGTETLNIRFRTGRMSKSKGQMANTPPIDLSFRVHAVRLAERSKPNETLYVLDLISEDFVRNLSMKVSRSFTKRPPHEILTGILKNDLESSVPTRFNEGFDRVSYIAPYSNPFEIITHLVRATKQDGTSDAVFFRSSRGYVLESLMELATNNPYSHEFYEVPEGTPPSSLYEYLNSVEEVYPIDHAVQDYLQSLQTGQRGISMMDYNRQTKAFSYAAESVPVMIPVHDSSSNLLAGSIQSRRKEMGTAFAAPMIFVLGGFSGRAVGDSFTFRAPAGGFVKDFRWSTIYSGTYVMTKLSHLISRFEYTNTIEAIRTGNA